MKKQILYLQLIFILLVIGYIVFDLFYADSKIAYVDTSKLMVGFSKSAQIEQELKVEDEKWRVQLKTLQDSLQAVVDTMSKYYNVSSPDQKKRYQDNLSAWNQRVNNFQHANMTKMQKMRDEKMADIAKMVNLYIDEYGKKNRYDIIFGTAVGGSILYGNTNRKDITQKIVQGLNVRYN